jgi:two-component system sensor histidine kinase ChiS
LQPARIVRVGGSPSDFEAFASVLATAGQHDVRHVASAVEAEEAIAGRRVDLVLLDVTGPNAEIVAVLQAAGRGDAERRVPVIATGPPEMNDRIAVCLQRGAEDYLTTPIDVQRPLLVTRRIQLVLYRRMLREATVRINTVPAMPVDRQAADAEVSARFVPREFLEHLGRHSLSEVRLGDHVERRMSVMFTDIRDFTTLSEQLTPQENFNFLNSFLTQVTPIIRNRGGFVDKYIGDAIMALFPSDPHQALTAAIEMQRQVVRYNQGRLSAGYVPIRIGVGLHRGDLILGTIGEVERMQTTVISDVVNVASRIEGLTKTFGVPLLVSRAVVDDLDGSAFRLRHLGAVKAKGKTRSVEIYECFENDPADLVEHKSKTAELFARGVAEFRGAKLLSAGATFARIASMHPGDTAAAYYRDSISLDVARRRDRDLDGLQAIEVQ